MGEQENFDGRNAEVIGGGVEDDVGVAAQVQQGARAAVDRLKWGQFRGIDAIRAELESAHARITTWKNNFFQMPRNATGKDAIRECTRLLQQQQDSMGTSCYALFDCFSASYVTEACKEL